MQKVSFLSIILFLAMSVPGISQKFSKAFSGSGPKKVVFYLENTDIHIQGYSGATLEVESDGYEGIPERAKGLRPLYHDAMDNTGMGLEINESGNVITVKKATGQDLELVVKVPADASVFIEETSWQGGDFKISGVNGEIEFKGTGSEIVMENVTGPVVANSTSGDITVVFSQLKQDAPSSISNISGFIDVTVPSSIKANLELGSITGEVYTDLDIKIGGDDKNLKRIGGGSKFKGTVNGGGGTLKLNNISGEIYLRKK